MTGACPFCQLSDAGVRLAFEHHLVIRDANPVSAGHTLIISRRHVGSVFELSPAEFGEIHSVLRAAKKDIETDFSPDDYNVGINDGPVAGQTVAHLHIHLIPRYVGDLGDPRGGVRWVLPERANYWD